MKAIVIGSNGKIGSQLCRVLVDAGYEVNGFGRSDLDLAALPDDIQKVTGAADAVYICAAVTRFIDCEDNNRAYSVNVDAPLEIARQFRGSGAKVFFLSSEAVERALHTNYGMHKALAETSLSREPNVVIVRLSKVENVDALCEFLVSLVNAKSGLYRWPGKYRQPTFSEQLTSPRFHTTSH